MTITAHVVPRITGTLPPQDIDRRTWKHNKGLPLADQLFFRPGSSDLLLGADIYESLLTGRIQRGTAVLPIAQHTHLEWVVSGPTTDRTAAACQGYTCSSDQEFLELVRKFWAQESLKDSHQARLTREEQDCEARFISTHSRLASGRYEVKLPFKKQPSSFGDIKDIADKMLNSLHRRFKRDGEFKSMYCAFLQDYHTLGHMELANSSGPDDFFLSHHGVLRRDSTSTTKLRVVFNGSLTPSTGVSLNDCLHAGAKLQYDLMDVILRWRLPAFVLADIEKMHRQISVHPQDQKFQKILWRENEATPVSAFQLTTVAYGLACAPFLVIRTLHQLAKDEKSRYPLALATVHRNMYVDDVLAGADSIQEALDIVFQVDNLLDSGGFSLQKWPANHPTLLGFIAAHHQASALKSFEDAQVKALGLLWSLTSDAFIISYSKDVIHQRQPHTRQSVLSTIARLFDPLVWLAPVVIRAKIFLQTLWKEDLQWDDPLSPQLRGLWDRILSDCVDAEPVQLPRWVGFSSSAFFELHGYSDASQSALAAVIYIRIIGSNSDVRTALFVSKTRVAPLMRITIARLELSAAVLLAQLLKKVQTSFDLPPAPVYCWADSSVSVTWIRGSPAHWKEFVGNRVALIQELLPNAHWNLIAGCDNPADVAS